MFWKKKKSKYITPHLTDQNFNEVIQQTETPILIDFYSHGCGPCKVLGPFIDELSEEYQGKALVAKINSAQNPGLSQHFKVRSVPTLIFIHKGKIVDRFTGLVPKPNLEEILDGYIDGNY